MRAQRRRRAAGAVLLCGAAFGGPIAAAEDWERAPAQDGIAVEYRDPGDAKIHELRLTGHTRAAPGAVAAVLWDHAHFPEFVPYVKRLDLLRDDGDTRLVYEQIHVPLLKDRDIVLRLVRSRTPETGVHEVHGRSMPDEGPPPDGSHVRVRLSESAWRLAPAEDGGTDATYTIRTDGGGVLPRWILEMGERKASVELMRAMFARAESRPEPSPPAPTPSPGALRP